MCAERPAETVALVCIGAREKSRVSSWAVAYGDPSRRWPCSPSGARVLGTRMGASSVCFFGVLSPSALSKYSV